jgi:hypothetical protein
MDSVNATDTPVANTGWNWQQVGWLYTPSFDYSLDGVLTRFGTAGSAPVVTEEIWSARPSAGGTLLRSGDFTASTGFAGATFAPLDLIAGQAYFIGFKNVAGLGVNVATGDDPTNTFLGSLWGSPSLSGTYDNDGGTWLGAPILQFSGETEQASVPEPGTLMLLTAGLGLLALRLRR